VYVGTIQPRKGADLFVESMIRVLRAERGLTARLIGPDTMTGPSGGSLRAHLESTIPGDLSGRLIFEGAAPHVRALEALASARLAIVPSRFDSFSFAAAEALLAGTPVLVTDAVGIAEHVPALPQARAGDAESVAEAALTLLSNGARSERDAWRHRETLLWACAPERHLALRSAWLDRVRRTEPPRIPSDGLVEIESFIRRTEILVRGG